MNCLLPTEVSKGRAGFSICFIHHLPSEELYLWVLGGATPPVQAKLNLASCPSNPCLHMGHDNAARLAEAWAMD